MKSEPPCANSCSLTRSLKRPHSYPAPSLKLNSSSLSTLSTRFLFKLSCCLSLPNFVRATLRSVSSAILCWRVFTHFETGTPSQASSNHPRYINRLMPKDAKTRQLRKIDNRGGRENASKKRLRVHFALQLCGVKDATNHNCRLFYIVVSIF